VSQRQTRLYAGFTLIEMLIVMAIIAILVGLLVPTLGAVREKAKEKATRTLVDGIVAGLERYFTEFDEYPPSTVSGAGDPAEAGSLYKYLCGQDGRGIVKVTGVSPNVRTQRMDPLISPPVENLRKSGADTLIVDSWNKEIVYRNSLYYTQEKRKGGVLWVPDGTFKNPNSFDLLSCGKDKVEDQDPPDLSLKQPNDVTNWTRR